MADEEDLTEEERAWVDFWVSAGKRRRLEVLTAAIKAREQGVEHTHVIEDRRSLGQRVLSALRGRVGGEPPGVSEAASQWWFMLGWVTRGCAVGLPDDERQVIDAFAQVTLGTGESKGPPPQ